MGAFDDLRGEIERGLNGDNEGLPMGFPRLNRFVRLNKRIYTVVMGSTGTGKSAFVHNSFILNPFDWVMSKNNTKGIKMKVFLFSMERSKVLLLAKWVSRKIFLDKGVLIPIQKLLGWWDRKIDQAEYQYFEQYEDYINRLTECVDIIGGSQNPTGVFKDVRAYAEANGKTIVYDEFHKEYIPNDPYEIVIPIVDHYGLTKIEKGMSKKEAIDKVSEYFQIFRDFYGYSPVGVAQLNRDISNPIYQKMDSFEPSLDNAKESGRYIEDSDQVLSIFEPLRYKTKNLNYNAEKFVNDQTGERHFRSVSILKNSYGESDISIGMAMQGATGFFKELPKPSHMEAFDYDTVLTNQYYLTN